MTDPNHESGVSETPAERRKQLLNEAQFAAAAEACELTVTENPNAAEAWRDLGLTYMALGQTTRATDAFNRAIQIRPDFANAWDLMGMNFMEEYQWALAVIAFEQAVKSAPDYAPSWGTLAQCYAMLKQKDKALAAVEHVRQIDAKMAKNAEFLVHEFLEYDVVTKEIAEKYGIP